MTRIRQTINALIPSRPDRKLVAENERLRAAAKLCREILDAGEHNEANGYLLLREEDWGAMDEVLKEPDDG